MKIPDYSQFIIEKKFIEETVIFPGRFQPFHLGHIESFENAKQIFGGVKISPIIIWTRTSEKSPFDLNLMKEMAGELRKEYKDLFHNFFIFKTVDLPAIVDGIRKFGYEPIGMATGSDRAPKYKPQVEKLASGFYDVDLDRFDMRISNVRSSDGISGTKVRNYIKENNIEDFKRATPECLHPFFDRLQNAIN